MSSNVSLASVKAGTDLVPAMQQASLVGSLHGFPGQPGFFRRSHGPGWALVGDAGYFKDPITAHGITDALIDAEHLARAIVTGTGEALDATAVVAPLSLQEQWPPVTGALAHGARSLVIVDGVAL